MFTFLNKGFDFTISKNEEDNDYWDFELKPMKLESLTKDEILGVMNELICEIEDELNGYDDDPNEDIRVDEAIMKDKGMFL